MVSLNFYDLQIISHETIYKTMQILIEKTIAFMNKLRHNMHNLALTKQILVTNRVRELKIILIYDCFFLCKGYILQL